MEPLRLQTTSPRAEPSRQSAQANAVDVALVGCGRSKSPTPAPARDLYTGHQFKLRRRFAEAASTDWFVLSAEHGLVHPDEWLAPYDLHLSDTSASYRRAWGEWCVARLEAKQGPLRGRAVSILAPASYADALRAPLHNVGANVSEPLAGLRQAEQGQWLKQQTIHLATGVATPAERSRPTVYEVDVNHLVSALSDVQSSLSPMEFLDAGAASLRVPGLYSWWVDVEGALELSRALPEPIGAGLIYAGQAGATHWPSGAPSGNTLWGRLTRSHIGGNVRGSTFRLTLGSLLSASRDDSAIDEAELSAWIMRHLRVLAVPCPEADAIDELEQRVLAVLDPPLNLQHMSKTAVRMRLRDLRRRFDPRTGQDAS